MTIDPEIVPQNIDDTFSKVDLALYKAKETGRNRVVDYDSMNNSQQRAPKNTE